MHQKKSRKTRNVCAPASKNCYASKKEWGPEEREEGIVIVVIRIRTGVVANHIRKRATKPGAAMSCRTISKARKAEKPRSQCLRLKLYFNACRIILDACQSIVDACEITFDALSFLMPMP